MSESGNFNEETKKPNLKKIKPFHPSRKLSPPRKTSKEEIARMPSTVPLSIADTKSLTKLFGRNLKDSSKE
jgi:hypothetical protein